MSLNEPKHIYNTHDLLWKRLRDWLIEESSRCELRMLYIRPEPCAKPDPVSQTMTSVNWAVHNAEQGERLAAKRRELKEQLKIWERLNDPRYESDAALSQFREVFRERLLNALCPPDYRADNDIQAAVRRAHWQGRRDAFAHMMSGKDGLEDLGFSVL